MASDSNLSQWGYTLLGNSIHDSWGECADVLAVDGATVEGNRIYNCVSANLYVSSSRNVTVNRNWLYESSDQYNRPDLGYRASGIELANEGASAGWSVNNVRITNNIVEWVAQALRYWRARSGGSVADTYGNLYVGFNDFNRTQFGPIHFDTPDGDWPSAQSRLRQNLVLNQSPYTWFSTGTWGAWNVDGNWNYGKSATSTNPGIQDTWGSYIRRTTCAGGRPSAGRSRRGASRRCLRRTTTATAARRTTGTRPAQ